VVVIGRRSCRDPEPLFGPPDAETATLVAVAPGLGRCLLCKSRGHPIDVERNNSVFFDLRNRGPSSLQRQLEAMTKSPFFSQRPESAFAAFDVVLLMRGNSSGAPLSPRDSHTSLRVVDCHRCPAPTRVSTSCGNRFSLFAGNVTLSPLNICINGFIGRMLSRPC